MQRKYIFGLLVIALILVSPVILNEYSYGIPDIPIPSIDIGLSTANSPEEVASTINIVILLTILSLAPSILIMTTSFSRIIIILSFLRKALSTQSVPPNQVLIALALFLTFYIMAPTFSEINSNALQPYLRNEISFEEGMENAIKPLKEFMLKQTRPKDIALFANLANDNPDNIEDISLTVLIPAFIISELKTGFSIGFLLFIPFLVIDMIVASTLMSMGMMMLPPAMISLPFKILLFIMIDGWNIVVKNILLGFN